MAKLLSIKNGIPFSEDVAGTGVPYDQYITLISDVSGPFTLPSGQTYNPGQNELIVIVDGVVQVAGLDYTEINPTQINFLKVVKAGQTIRVRR
jgi:hypothetical protein